MRISIITVCYNSVATLATAMESVVDQTYQDIEYIVVDGGSKDGTVEIIRRYESKRGFRVQGSGERGDENQRTEGGQLCLGSSVDAMPSTYANTLPADKMLIQGSPLNPDLSAVGIAKAEPCHLTPKHPMRMRWISEPDEGMYDAINKGIRMATGDVVGILNADDFLADDRVIERVANTFLTTKNTKSTKIDVVYGDVRFIREGKREKLKGTMIQCANAGMCECGNQKCENAGMRECANGESSQGSTNELMNYRTNELVSLRQATTLRYYSAKRWKPWMLQWGYMPPHPGVYIRRECFERLGYYKLGYHIAADYELLIRYLHKGGLTMRYLDACIVGMRPGGKSTKNWRSNVLLNQEIVRGNRENGYFCFMLMLAPKYVFKIFEFIVPWAKGKMRSELVL